MCLLVRCLKGQIPTKQFGHHVVGAEVGVLVVEKGAGGLFAEIEVDAADGHVHWGEAPSGGAALLVVNGDRTESAAVGLDELLVEAVEELLVGGGGSCGRHGLKGKFGAAQIPSWRTVKEL